MSYSIDYDKGHFIITDSNGKFICSCDSYKEAEEEIKEMEEIK